MPSAQQPLELALYYGRTITLYKVELYLITAGSQTIRTYEPGEAWKRATISGCLVVLGKPGRLINYPGYFKSVPGKYMKVSGKIYEGEN